MMLVRKHERSVYNLVFRILKNKEVAEEVAQDVFLKSFKELKHLEDPSKYKPWLLKIAYRKSIDRVRLKKVQMAEIDELSIPVENHNATPDPLELLQKEQLKQQVEELLEQLSEVDRGIMTLYYLEDFKVAEVAAVIGLSENNVKIKLMRARAFLKNELIQRSTGKEDLY
ncbi:RNA polymerase sigma factor [Fulvivirgaceae bacterium BMA10]|uniref:RNA polymerase sigma factor n=1 Tax=Splendidivirga corallicola TaxID=3051826 RepID=A0ABT8KT01_9BACT|nr:RNA polymerase sigma factor [Fulvivirgaceae bacterium BMA10]